MSHDAFAAGIRLYLTGEREAARHSFLKACDGGGYQYVCEAMAIWCQNGAEAGIKAVEMFDRAVGAGFIDLNYMPFLGLAADKASRDKELPPLTRIALTQVAIDALRLSSELSGAVRRRVEERDGEVLAYRLAVCEHELPRLQRKFAEDYRSYQSLQLRHLDLAKGRVETSLSILRELLESS
ncbi:MAG TPA: hypothetical protein VK905_04395 [Bacillota bacterium]|nr:hypothetical protein [Bacillota bacterium]